MKQLSSILLMLGLMLSSGAAQAAMAPKGEVERAGIFLRDFEKEVERAKGSGGRFFNKQETLTRVKSLAERFPDDPRVMELVRRTSVALMKSKGGFMEITPDMTRYLRNEKELKDAILGENRGAWQSAMTELSPDTNVFPTPDPEAVDFQAQIGRHVLLTDVMYPEAQFVGGTGEYLRTGKPSTGFYFIIMDRRWRAMYEAVRRYRSLVDAELGDNIAFSVIGKVSGAVMESPYNSENDAASVAWGWVVLPERIMAGDRVVARYDETRPELAFFYGEDRVAGIKDGWYTVRSIPDDVDPKRLMEIFMTAIKEKNFELYRQCILPDRTKTADAKSQLGYHWDLHQARFANEYVHAVFDDPKITVLKGFDSGNDAEAFFLNPEQRKQIGKMEGEREEMAVVMSQAFDRNGKQLGSKNRHELRRKGNGRWYVNTYDVRF